MEIDKLTFGDGVELCRNLVLKIVDNIEEEYKEDDLITGVLYSVNDRVVETLAELGDLYKFKRCEQLKQFFNINDDHIGKIIIEKIYHPSP